MQAEKHRYNGERYTGQDIRNTFHDHIHGSAVVTFYGTVKSTDRKVDDRNRNSENKAESCTACKAGEYIITVYVRTENERRFKSVFIYEIIVGVKTHYIVISGFFCSGTLCIAPICVRALIIRVCGKTHFTEIIICT